MLLRTVPGIFLIQALSQRGNARRIVPGSRPITYRLEFGQFT
jgi:hypothetical protein